MNEKLVALMQSFEAKKILALDGGGIRGMIMVRMLEKIEILLSQKRWARHRIITFRGVKYDHDLSKHDYIFHLHITRRLSWQALTGGRFLK